MLKAIHRAVTSWFASAEDESPVLADARPDLTALAAELRQQAERRQPRIQPAKIEQRERLQLPEARPVPPNPEIARRKEREAALAHEAHMIRQAEVNWRESALSPEVATHRPAAAPRLQRNVRTPKEIVDRGLEKAALPPPAPSLPPPEVPQVPVAAAGRKPKKKRAAKRKRIRSKPGDGAVTPRMQPRLAAAAWLGQQLAAGPRDYEEIRPAALAAGHKLRTLDRARDVIDAESVDIGGGRTEWRMRAAK